MDNMDTETRIAKLETSVDSLALSVSNFVSESREEFRQLRNAVNQPTDWRGNAMIIIAVLSILGALIAFVISPLGASVVRLMEFERATAIELTALGAQVNEYQSEAERDRYAQADRLEALEDRNSDIEQRIARNETNLINLMRLVETIDEKGSRKWIGDRKD